MTDVTAGKPTRLTADKLVQFRLPLAVYDLVEQHAKDAGAKSIALYARDILGLHIQLGLKPTRPSGESSILALSSERKEALRQIARTGVLLNQIAARLNAGIDLDQQTAERIRQSLDLLDAASRSIRTD